MYTNFWRSTLVAQSEARSRKDAEAEQAADSALVQASFWAIQHKQYDSARVVLEYAHKLRLSTDTYNLMVVVNLAQTYKWSGNEDACLELLNARDWNSTSNLFRLCVAALREGDPYDEFLRGVAQEKALSLEDIHDWPVFSALRRRECFPESVRAAFGDSNVPGTPAAPPVLLNFRSEARAREIKKYLKENRPGRELGESSDHDPPPS